jgi:hypothetical protein
MCWVTLRCTQPTIKWEHPSFSRSPQAISLGLIEQSLPPQAEIFLACGGIYPAGSRYASNVRIAIPFQGIDLKSGMLPNKIKIIHYNSINAFCKTSHLSDKPGFSVKNEGLLYLVEKNRVYIISR